MHLLNPDILLHLLDIVHNLSLIHIFKKEVIELDEQMRTYEQEMKHLTGDALEQKMNQYTNATHRFEQLNGCLLYTSDCPDLF